MQEDLAGVLVHGALAVAYVRHVLDYYRVVRVLILLVPVSVDL